MGLEFDEVSDKPERWPANAIECHLDNICNQVNKFKQNPTYKNKEVLVSLVTAYDLNQTSMTGLIRTTDYEVACINSLYVDASIIQLNALKTYLYELVGYKTRIQKMVSWFPKIKETSEVEAFCGLLPQLRLYYVTYHNFTIAKNKKYVSHLINFVTEMIEDSRKNDSDALFCELIGNVTCSYVSLLNDISYFRCVKRTRIWAFDREEIYSLFQLAAKLIKLNRESPVVSPLKGVLMTSISNYILKSRNDYSDAYICKYISPEVAKQSIVNHQIWMSVIEHLNDERERRVIPELFDEVGWGSYSWAKNMNFMPRRKYYVSSFCK